MSKRKLAITLLISAAAIGGCIVAAPRIIEKKLLTTLIAKGIKEPALTITHIGTDSAVINDTALGVDHKIKMERLEVGYKLPDLTAAKVEKIKISGLTTELYQDDHDKPWTVGGLENLSAQTKETPEPISLNITALKSLPFESLEINESSIKISSGTLATKIGFNFNMTTTPQHKISLRTDPFDINAGKIKASIGRFNLDISSTEDNGWAGKWDIEALSIFETPVEVPSLNARGEIYAKDSRIKLSAALKDDSGAYNASFTASYDIAAKAGTIDISLLSMPWNQGRVGISDGKILLSQNSIADFKLNVEHVSMAELMKSLTGENASATGLVSGTLPVTINADGSVKIHSGQLLADAPGVISIKPELIPGDGTQIKTARDILQDLHYENLSISVKENDGNKISIILSVEGKNPKVQKGNPVKLNVTLNGDMLSLISNNVAALINPHKLLENTQNE